MFSNEPTSRYRDHTLPVKWSSHATARRRSVALTVARAHLSMAAFRDRAMIKYLKGRHSVLDIGCGGGRPILKAICKRVCGIEPNEDLCRQSRQLYDFVGPWSIENNMRALAETFDAVVSTDVMGHINCKDVFVSECHRMLKPGGITVHVVEPHPYNNWIYRYALKDFKTCVRNWETIPDHHHLVTPGAYRCLFERHFSRVQVIPIQGIIPQCGLLSVLIKDTPNLPAWLRALRAIDGALSSHIWLREAASLILTPLGLLNRFARTSQGLGLLIVGYK